MSLKSMVMLGGRRGNGRTRVYRPFKGTVRTDERKKVVRTRKKKQTNKETVRNEGRKKQ